MDGKVKHRQELDDPCDGCIHAPNDEREYYDEACFDCSRFYADRYTKIDEEMASSAIGQSIASPIYGSTASRSSGTVDGSPISLRISSSLSTPISVAGTDEILP